jgi:hypothetical protein
VDQAISGVRLEATYWEKWKMRNGFFRSSYMRYKYYVLGSMPRQDYERLRKALVETIARKLEKGG